MKTKILGKSQISLTVTFSTINFWGMIVELILIIGGSIAFTIAAAVGYVTYQLRKRNH